MQISDTFSKGGLPSPNGGGGTPTDVATQLQQQKERHRRILMLRTLRNWWYPIFLAALGSFVAVELAQTVAISYPVQIILVLGVAIVALPVYILCIKHVEFGIVLFALATTALAPKLLSLKSA